MRGEGVPRPLAQSEATAVIPEQTAGFFGQHRRVRDLNRGFVREEVTDQA